MSNRSSSSGGSVVMKVHQQYQRNEDDFDISCCVVKIFALVVIEIVA